MPYCESLHNRNMLFSSTEGRDSLAQQVPLAKVAINPLLPMLIPLYRIPNTDHFTVLTGNTHTWRFLHIADKTIHFLLLQVMFILKRIDFCIRWYQ